MFCIGIFICGIIFNEGLLLNQGIFAMKYENIPYINELLLMAAGIMFIGVTMLVSSQFGKFEEVKPVLTPLPDKADIQVSSPLADTTHVFYKTRTVKNRGIRRLWGRWKNRGL